MAVETGESHARDPGLDIEVSVRENASEMSAGGAPLLSQEEDHVAEDMGDEGEEGRTPRPKRPKRSPAIVLGTRGMEMVPSSLNEEERTIEMTAATGTPVRRTDLWSGDEYDEVLDMSERSVRLDRLNMGAPLLDSHDYYSGTRAILGAIVPGSARVSDGRLIAKAKFSRSEQGERAFRDAKDGILRHVSVGYLVHKRKIDDKTSPPIHLAIDWEPHEISAVAIPADHHAGFRSAEFRSAPVASKGEPMTEVKAEAAPAMDQRAIEETIRARVESELKAEQDRRDGIAEIARKLSLPAEFAEEHIRAKTSLEEFRAKAIDKTAEMEREAPASSLNPRGFPAYLPLARPGRKEPEAGARAMRMISCVGIARKFGLSPIEVATRNMGDDPVGRDMVVRAMQASIGSAGGYLIPTELSAELIDLLRPRTVVRWATPASRQISIPRGNLRMGRINQGATLGYVGEGTSSAATQDVIGDINFSARKAKAIVPISNDLIRFAQGSADALVRDDLIRQLAVLEDTAFLRGMGTQWTPKGMRFLAASANIIASQSGYSTATAISDMSSLVNALEAAAVPMTNPHWFMSQRSKNFLYDQRDSVGGFLFRAEMDRGTFRGIPFSWTQSIPQNLGVGGNASEIYLVDMDEFIIADVPGLMIDASQEASYSPDGSSLVSSFDKDETVIRVIAEHDCNVKHTASVGVLTSVLWGT